MKKIQVEQVSVNGYDFTGVVYGDQLPLELQLIFNIPDHEAVIVYGNFEPVFGTNDPQLGGGFSLSLHGLTVGTIIDNAKIDLTDNVDMDTLKDVILTKADTVELLEDYQANRVVTLLRGAKNEYL